MKSIPPQQLEDVRKWAEHYQEARRLLAVVGDEYWNKVGKKRKA
jgi:hypothetical protein